MVVEKELDECIWTNEHELVFSRLLGIGFGILLSVGLLFLFSVFKFTIVEVLFVLFLLGAFFIAIAFSEKWRPIVER